MSTGEAVAFWILGPVALLGAIGMVLLRNAIHSALSLVATMMCLGLFYLIEQGPFLGLVQIIVYTGAIMILFLFVLMLVGRDSSDSLVETLRGQRVAGLLAGVAFALLVALAIGRAFTGQTAKNLDGPNSQYGTNVNGIAQAAVHQVPVRLRADLGAADRGRGRRDGAGAHRAGRAPSAARRRWPASGSAPAGRSRCPVRACCPPATRSAPRRCCRTARSPASRCSAARRSMSASGAPRLRATVTTGSRRRLPMTVSRLAERRARLMTPTYYLVLSAALFSIGAVGVLIRRNAIVVFMCVELMLNAVNLTLVTFARINGSLDGQIMAFFVMVVAAAEVVVGLAIIMSIFRTRRSASVDDANLLKY